jgi:hypothetical protein
MIWISLMMMSCFTCLQAEGQPPGRGEKEKETETYLDMIICLTATFFPVRVSIAEYTEPEAPCT